MLRFDEKTMQIEEIRVVYTHRFEKYWIINRLDEKFVVEPVRSAMNCLAVSMAASGPRRRMT